MQLGFLTAVMQDDPLELVTQFAAEVGFEALEVVAGPGGKHIDTARLTKTKAKKILNDLYDKGLVFSSLAYYTDSTDPRRRRQVIANAKKTIDAAVMLETDVVCMLAGMPVGGKSKMETIEQDVPKVFGPIVDYARRKRVKIALENWYATNIQHLDHWKRIFEVVPSKHFGLNFDPSHLYWMGIDHIEAVDLFADRIFHTHAKDCEVREHVRRRVGVLGNGWWRYCIPGYGAIDWGQYIGRLRDIGYDGVLSIEHEDRTFTPKEGLCAGLVQLEVFA